MASYILSLNQVSLSFGHHALLDKVDFSLSQGERVGLIGRNGTGKSSFLKVLDGRIQADEGEVQKIEGLHVHTVEQEPVLPDDQSIFDYLAGDYLVKEHWQKPAEVNRLLDELGLNPKALIGEQSGGTKKRIALCHAFLQAPDVLCLDEPTNHLDFIGIQWLTQWIKQSSCALVVITHDRHFLDEISTRIVELDRGYLYGFPGNFTQWQVQKNAFLEDQAKQNARFDKLLAQEEVWIRKGIEARRTRNEGRVRRLKQLRVERAARRDRLGQVNFTLASGERSGKLVAELKQVSHRFDHEPLIKNFSTTIMRGDKVAIIGPNGVGKTTMIHIILGQLQPTEGHVKLGTHLQLAYFDQMRTQLDEDAPLTDVINPGSEWVEIGSERKHVMSYLEDFLFSPMRAHSPVSSLSGGERARLLLARLFARPANVLILDEPTNDLDIDTLELLEQLLLDYQGTVLLVSHDQAFLDQVATQSIAFEGDGQWRVYPGGYSDWKTQSQFDPVAWVAKQYEKHAEAKTSVDMISEEPSLPKLLSVGHKKPPKRLTTRQEQLLSELPDRIAGIEAEQAVLAEKLNDPSLYQGTDSVHSFQALNESIEKLQQEHDALMEKWLELEQIQEAYLAFREQSKS